jgi:uncharacterized protein YqiB (DUF1249 family)
MLKEKIKNTHSKSNYINQNCVTIQHEDNYLLLKHLIPTHLQENQQFKSTTVNKPELMLKVIQKYKYTVELELKYLFKFGHSENIIIRLYQDAKVAEIMHCTDLQKFIRLLGPKISPKVHVETRSALNVFLNKWLNFLMKNNYSHQNWLLIQV